MTRSPSIRAIALCALLAAALPAGAEPLPVGSAFEPLRLRNEVRDSEGALFGLDDLEISREGARVEVRWSLRRPDGRLAVERSVSAIRGGELIPLSLRRTERDEQGTVLREMWADGLAAPEGEVTLHLRDAADGKARTKTIDVDDPPLYPSSMAGAIFQAIVDGERDSVRFTTLVEYPWGPGPADLEASVLEDRPPVDTLFGRVPLRRVHLRALRSWLVELVIRMIGIQTSVYLDVAYRLPARPLAFYEGPIAHDSGVVRGSVIAFRRLAEGERLDSWPPPPDHYGPDALPAPAPPPPR